MGYHDDDSARIAAANLLDNYREQWNENFTMNREVGGTIDDHIFNFMIGDIRSTREIVKTLNESVMLTPANKPANRYLAWRIKEFIRHISRRKPKPHLTIKYMRSIQQAYVDAISAHFVHQSQLVSMVLIEVFSNIKIITKSHLIPKSVKDEIDYYKGMSDEYDEEEEIE